MTLGGAAHGVGASRGGATPSCGCASYQATVVGGLRLERRQAVNLAGGARNRPLPLGMEKAQ
jgi:hypothetical protein